MTRKVTIDGADRPDLAPEVLVFAKTMTVSAVVHASGDPIADAYFEVPQHPAPSGVWGTRSSFKTRRTDAKGEPTFDLAFPDVVQLACKRPWILTSWTDGRLVGEAPRRRVRLLPAAAVEAPVGGGRADQELRAAGGVLRRESGADRYVLGAGDTRPDA